ncbi:hypothetical protein [Agrobacterium rosae]
MTERVDIAPVVVIIFNRPDLTARLFEQISQAEPKQLLIVADGPRATKMGEAEKCFEARQIFENITWECDVLRNYSEHNLGCRARIASGLDWVFSKVDRAIILEDDCIPDGSFFEYCSDLLEHYKDDTRIGCISGTNMGVSSQPSDSSYYFSKYPLVWGWATWARVWQNYNVDIPQWGKVRDTEWLKSITYEDELIHWAKAFNLVFEEGFDTWDYQLVFSLWRQRQLTLLPATNLISNIGFREDATHTKRDHPLANLQRDRLEFPLRHPTDFNPNFEIDNGYRAKNCTQPKRKNRWRRLVRKIGL